MRYLLAAVIALTSCGGTGPLSEASSSASSSAGVVAALGRRCTFYAPAECPVVVGLRAGLVCGNDRFGWACTAFCYSSAPENSDQACQDPATVCLDRVGAEDAGYPGFCWKRCATDLDCAADLRCISGICGPR